MTDLFFQLISKLQGNYTDYLLKNEGDNFHDEKFQQKDVFSSSIKSEEIIDIGLSLDDGPLPRKPTPSVIDKPSLSTFWPGKTAQYWIPSNENQNGKHLALDLSFALLGKKEIAPSNDVPLLFYHANPDRQVYVLCFKDPLNPFIRGCERSIENELYNKSLEDNRILLVPTYNIPKNKLLILTSPVSNMGVLEEKIDLTWVSKYISNDNERCVFFEEGNTPNILRRSQVLSKIAQEGRLYIVMCAGELLSNSTIGTDINSPQKAVKKMFDKQLSMLCPGTWKRLLCDPQKRDLNDLIKELFNPIDESSIYHLKNIKISQGKKNSLVPFVFEIEQAVTAELKNIYLECIPDLIRTLKEDCIIEKKTLFDSIVLSVTQICYENYSSRKETLPKSDKMKFALLASILLLEFRFAYKIANNFIRELRKLEAYLQHCSTYDEGKHCLWNYFPCFKDICEKELLQLHKKSLKIQRAFEKIMCRDCDGE